MSNKPERLGQIVIDLYPGGVKKASFTGVVNHNDVFSSKITLQRDYAMYLNEQHLKHKREYAEKNRLQAESDAAEEEKLRKVKQEVEDMKARKASQIKVAEAKLAEMKVRDLTNMSAADVLRFQQMVNVAKQKVRQLKAD